MQVWKVIIRPDPQAPDLAQGYALAEKRKDVYERVGHPDTMVFWQHLQTPWPGEPGETLMLTSGWPKPSFRPTAH